MNNSLSPRPFRSMIALLWLRFVSLAVTALLFVETVMLASHIEASQLYLTKVEIAYEAAVRLIFVALIGMALGTLFTMVVAPGLWPFRSARERVTEWLTGAAVALVLFLTSRFALATLIRWTYNISEHRGIFDKAAWVAFYLAFALALCMRRPRQALLTSLDGVLSKESGRRIVIGTAVSAVALVIVEFALVRTAAPIQASSKGSTAPKTNILLITFDALNAEDLSVYGRGLATTPNLDAFARNATVFTNFYSTSTFTTPTIATIMTGAYPSESGVYHLKGHLRPGVGSLPGLLKSHGYAAGGFFSNPLAYYLATQVKSDFSSLPEPVFQPTMHRLWHATSWLHQDTGVGSRIGEYLELEDYVGMVAGWPKDPSLRMRPTEVFGEAKRILDQLPDGYFLWVHVITPHNPYLPDAADRGLFHPAGKTTVYGDDTGARWMPRYERDQQSQVDEHRLRYDEFLRTADRAFASFMSQLESSGRMQNTTVIVSADHGESFEGGIYQHKTAYQTRPVIHVPLIIKTPGQTQGARVAFAADQTALAPTVLELADLPKPEGMHGESLVPWLKGDSLVPTRLAFSQYVEKNSVFEPIRHGTMGVIDGHYQYVLDLDNGKGKLRPLNEAHIWDLDRTPENSAKADELLTAIYSRFPEVRRRESQ